jgi:hypothetical protein
LLHLVESSTGAECLITELESVFATANCPPEVLRMDNGSEMISRALQRFCDDKVRFS